MRRLRIVVDGRPFEASVEEAEDGSRCVIVEGETFEVRAVDRALLSRGLTIRFDDGAHEVVLEDLDHAVVDGVRSEFRLDQVQAGARAGVVGKEGAEVHPPMPGKVVSVLVQEGDIVEEGQVLLVLEAMKMQNEVVSPATGTVTRIRVQEGATVESRDVLIDLGPPADKGDLPEAPMLA